MADIECAGKDTVDVNRIGGLPKGVDAILRGERINSEAGNSEKPNTLIMEGSSTLIAGKNVKILEKSPMDSIGLFAKVFVGIAIAMFCPLALAVVANAANTTYNDKLKAVRNSNRDDNFFHAGLRDQIDAKWNSVYQDTQGLEGRLEARIEAIQSKIETLTSAKASPDLSASEKNAIDREINSLKAELTGTDKDQGLESRLAEVKTDLEQMKVAIQEIKGASTTTGVPSLESLMLFRAYSHNGDLYKDLKNSEGYFSYLASKYNDSDAPYASKVGDMLENLKTDQLTEGAIKDGIVGLSVENLREANIVKDLIKCMPLNNNPATVIPGPMLDAAKGANQALSELIRPATPSEKETTTDEQGFTHTLITHATISDITNDQSVLNEIKDYNKDFANTLESMERQQNRINRNNSKADDHSNTHRGPSGDGRHADPNSPENGGLGFGE